MNKDLFTAILALDSYNRGYGQGIIRPGLSSQIGNAVVTSQSIFTPGSDELAAGFYAAAYDVSNVTGFDDTDIVISYRGTDAFTSDAQTGVGSVT